MLFFASYSMDAQVGPDPPPSPEEEGPEPPPTSPISDWIPVVALSGIAYAGFYLVRRNAKATR